MVTLEHYLQNPCGTLSIPYWKNKTIQIPGHMKIVHDSAFSAKMLENYRDEPYFRLLHDLKEVHATSVDGFSVETAETGQLQIMESVINRSYTGLAVSIPQLESYTKTAVYRPELWIFVRENATGAVVGSGIADHDRETQELILEWIQVLPDYRGRKLGQLIVCELLKRGSAYARFATVSGKVNDPTSPETLYRKCGFTGDDLWHILIKK